MARFYSVTQPCPHIALLHTARLGYSLSPRLCSLGACPPPRHSLLHLSCHCCCFLLPTLSSLHLKCARQGNNAPGWDEMELMQRYLSSVSRCPLTVTTAACHSAFKDSVGVSVHRYKHRIRGNKLCSPSRWTASLWTQGWGKRRTEPSLTLLNRSLRDILLWWFRFPMLPSLGWEAGAGASGSVRVMKRNGAGGEKEVGNAHWEKMRERKRNWEDQGSSGWMRTMMVYRFWRQRCEDGAGWDSYSVTPNAWNAHDAFKLIHPNCELFNERCSLTPTPFLEPLGKASSGRCKRVFEECCCGYSWRGRPRHAKRGRCRKNDTCTAECKA